MTIIRVIEAYRNLFYSPIYVTHALGLFQDEDIDVTMRPREANEDMVDLLNSGACEIDLCTFARIDDDRDIGQHVCLTGIMRSLVAADRGQTAYPVAFAEVNSRDGFVMLSRRRLEHFRWKDVEGQTVISYREPPTPWMCLLRVFREQGVDPALVNLSVDMQIPAAIEAFRAGGGDFIELPEPFAHQLIADGVAHLATPMGRFVGTVPYSSFAATREALTQRHDDLLRFTRAVYAGQRWLAANTSIEIARQVAPYLPGFELDVLAQGVECYKSQDTWATDPLLRPEGFRRLNDILREGGLIKSNHAYEEQVSTTFAEAVMSESVGR